MRGSVNQDWQSASIRITLGGLSLLPDLERYYESSIPDAIAVAIWFTGTTKKSHAYITVIAGFIILDHDNGFESMIAKPPFLDLDSHRKGIALSQRHYALQLLEDSGYSACKPTVVPMDPKISLTATEGELLPDITHYRWLVGKLLYLTLSCLDITFAVHKLTQFLAQPRLPHLKAVHHLLHYLKNSPGQGLLFSSNSSLQLKAFSDADWGSCPDSRRSVTGFCIFIRDFLVSWKAKKQTTISRSSVEAEYRALSSTASELIWLQQLLQDFQVTADSPTLLYCDNQAAIHIASNPTFYECAKHIEIDCYFVHERVASGVLKLLPIRSQYQLADLFSKPLPSTQFFSLLSKMVTSHLEGEY
ncbi:uncharacterized protein LOC116143707 [Pistacia vera]|uniref:uncharacterized protein LOC116143707 n=1 Tax=Pistacia vera TaxID=55513 RepID=UPI001262CE09|nr:uncharacterized protein LOC116143707 [Pistacia vera]